MIAWFSCACLFDMIYLLFVTMGFFVDGAAVPVADAIAEVIICFLPTAGLLVSPLPPPLPRDRPESDCWLERKEPWFIYAKLRKGCGC